MKGIYPDVGYISKMPIFEWNFEQQSSPLKAGVVGTPPRTPGADILSISKQETRQTIIDIGLPLCLHIS